MRLAIIDTGASTSELGSPGQTSVVPPNQWSLRGTETFPDDPGAQQRDSVPGSRIVYGYIYGEFIRCGSCVPYRMSRYFPHTFNVSDSEVRYSLLLYYVLLLILIPDNRVLRRIPKSARQLCCSKLTTILEDIVKYNSVDSWNRLFLFAPRCLRQPRRGKQTESLARLVKIQLQEDLSTTTAPMPPTRRREQTKKRPDPMQLLARKISIKIEEGDFRGAIRLTSSDDILADFNDDTYNALIIAKHPPAHPDSRTPPSPAVSVQEVLEVSNMDVVQAIKSFPCGSAGGQISYVHSI